MSSIIDRFKKGSIWSLLARGSGALTGFLMTFLLASMMLIDELGIYFLVLLVARYAGHFMKFGLEISLQKFLGVYIESKEWPLAKSTLFSALIIIVVMATVVSLILHVFWPALAINLLKSPELLSVFSLCLLATILRALEELLSAFFRAVHEPKIGVFLLDLPRQTIFCIILGHFWFIGHELSLASALNWYVISSLASVSFSSLLALNWYIRNPVSNQKRVDTIHSLKKLTIISAPMMVHGVFALLVSSTDMWVVGYFQPKSDVGVYGAVVKLATLVNLILSVVTMVIPPMLSALYYQNKIEELQSLIRFSANISLLVVFPVLVVFSIWGGDILSLFFGDQFREGHLWLVILAFGYSSVVALGSPGWLLQMIGSERLLLKLTAIASLVNVLLSLLLIKILGVTGVAISSAVTFLLLNLVASFSLYKKINVKTWAGFNP